MEIAGIKTLSIFKRYNLVDESDKYKVMGREMPKSTIAQEVTTRGRHYAILKIMGIKCDCCNFK